jgi:SAM-dependent methyltransferase
VIEPATEVNVASRPIVYASKPAAVSMTDCWYDIASLNHFWIRRRFEVLKKLADSTVRGAARCAEIGCGNGLLQRSVEDHYGIPVAGFDLNELALQKSVSRTSPLFCYDIHHRAPEFRARFDALFLFDVLEHIADEDGFLQSVKYHLSPAGSLIVNVPAHQACYSRYDEAMGHVRRYSIGRLREVAERNGLRIRSFTYWGVPLLPLLIARKMISNLWRTKQDVISTGFDPGGKARNAALGFLSRCELLPQGLLGTSLMAVLEVEG